MHGAGRHTGHIAPTVTVTHDPLTNLPETPGYIPVGGFKWPVVRLVVEFSEPVADFDKSDLEFEGGRVAKLSSPPSSSDNPGSYRSVWVATIVPNAGFYGTMSIRVPAGAATDSSGLANTVSNTILITSQAKRNLSSRSGIGGVLSAT